MALIPFVNHPNRVVQKQRLYQAQFNKGVPPYLIGPRARLYFNTYVAMWSVGLLSATYGLYQLIAGKPATP